MFEAQWCCDRDESFEVYAAEIQDKTPEDVEKYYHEFQKMWKTLAGMLFVQSPQRDFGDA